MSIIKGLIQKHKRTLVVEGLLKAFFISLVIGFSANLIYIMFDWLFALKTFYLGIVIGIIVSTISTWLLYILKYKPTDKQVAQRLDALGLYERVITMNELKEDNSYIAKRQREDTIVALKNLSNRPLKIVMSCGLIIATILVAMLSTGVTVLAQNSTMLGLDYIIELIKGEEDNYLTISYEIDGEGYINGDLFQEIEKGKDGTLVTAIAEDGWMFVGWSDGLTEPTRQEIKVTEDVEVYAIFMEVEESTDADEDSDEENGENDGESNHPQEGEGDEGNERGDGAPGEENLIQSDGQYGNGDGSGIKNRDLDNNQIIDGETYYGDVLQDAINDVANNGNYNDIVINYLKGLGNTLKD